MKDSEYGDASLRCRHGIKRGARRLVGGLGLLSLSISAAKEKAPDAAQLWSLQAVRVTAPESAAPQGGNGIDAYLSDKLRAAGLSAAPEADRRTLIRRLSFDLLGLPPTPEEVEAFMRDESAGAYEKLVDRLLASPHYGERWARHWLDIAHYADTHGFERDQKRDHAWPYRDYVIRAFNDDKPYDRFIREQIAGDVAHPEDRDAVIATGFLAAGPFDFVGQMETPSPVLKRAARADDLDDMVTQVISATMGLTVNCARCHDHKLDPIPQADYYKLWSVFAGVKRGVRELAPPDAGGVLARRQHLTTELAAVESEIGRLEGAKLDLADVVGGGNGRGTGKAAAGFDPNTGKLAPFKQGFISEVKPNVFHSVLEREGKDVFPLIDGVVIPDGRSPVPISSTGLVAKDAPPTSAQAWDAIRNGPVNSQANTKFDGVDYAGTGHSMIGVHANAGITFDLAAIRKRTGQGALRFTAKVGYGGKPGNMTADFHVYVDGELAARRMKFGANDGLIPVDVVLAKDARFLTLMSTDGGNGISHDQVFFADAKLWPAEPASDLTTEKRARLVALQKVAETMRKSLDELPKTDKLFAVVSSEAPVIKVLKRGNTEDAGAEVRPGALSCLAHLPGSFGDNTMNEGQRRVALAEWITRSDNPLTARVMMNRLWHHHFGHGIVATPSDFGNGGFKPTHPELLDRLASEFMHCGWSVKAMQKLMVMSQAYRRSSVATKKAEAADRANALLARMSGRRLDAESLRDAVLAVSGCLNPAMGGPGYQDFEYQDAYAPIYRHVTADRPELWRRSVYRFIVRTTPQRFMSTLDCPNPANLTPARLVTTTALQSLALLNDEFMLKQAEYFAVRVQKEVGDEPRAQVERAFRLAFQRAPSEEESAAAIALIRQSGTKELCRMLFNANEFVFAD